MKQWLLAQASPDRIDVRALTNDVVELWDREGRSWVGSAERVLRALADLEGTDDPGDVRLRLALAAPETGR